MNTKDILGAQPTLHAKFRADPRDNLAVSDIAGAVPTRYVGYTGARPDMVVSRAYQDNAQTLKRGGSQSTEVLTTKRRIDPMYCSSYQQQYELSYDQMGYGKHEYQAPQRNTHVQRMPTSEEHFRKAVPTSMTPAEPRISGHQQQHLNAPPPQTRINTGMKSDPNFQNNQAEFFGEKPSPQGEFYKNWKKFYKKAGPPDEKNNATLREAISRGESSKKALSKSVIDTSSAHYIKAQKQFYAVPPSSDGRPNSRGQDKSPQPMRHGGAAISAGLEIIKETPPKSKANINPPYGPGVKQSPSVKRSLGLSPTTELAHNGIGISSSHYNRESNTYGKMMNELPGLNNLNYHRNNNMSNFTYNILTGSYSLAADKQRHPK